MLSGSGIHMLTLPKPLQHSSLNWQKPLPRLIISAYLPLFWADVKLTKRVYFSKEAADILVIPGT